MFMLPTTVIQTAKAQAAPIVASYEQFRGTVVGGWLLPKVAHLAGSTIGMAFPEVVIAQYAVGKAAECFLVDSKRKEMQVRMAAVSAGALMCTAIYYDTESQLFSYSVLTSFALQFAGSIIGSREAGRVMGVQREESNELINPELVRQFQGAVVCEAVTQIGQVVFNPVLAWPIGSVVGLSGRIVARQAGYYAKELCAYERGRNGYDVGELFKLYIDKTHGGTEKFVAKMTRSCTRIPFGEKTAASVLTHLIDSKQGAHALVTAFNRYRELTNDPMSRALSQLVEVQPGKREVLMLEAHLHEKLFSQFTFREKGMATLFQRGTKGAITQEVARLCVSASKGGVVLPQELLEIHAIQLATLAFVMQFGQSGGVKPITEEENVLFYRNINELLFGYLGDFTGREFLEGAVHMVIPTLLKQTPFIPLVLMDKEVKQVEEVPPPVAVKETARVSGFIASLWGRMKAFVVRLFFRQKERTVEEVLADAQRVCCEVKAWLKKV